MDLNPIEDKPCRSMAGFELDMSLEFISLKS